MPTCSMVASQGHLLSKQSCSSMHCELAASQPARASSQPEPAARARARARASSQPASQTSLSCLVLSCAIFMGEVAHPSVSLYSPASIKWGNVVEGGEVGSQNVGVEMDGAGLPELAHEHRGSGGSDAAVRSGTTGNRNRPVLREEKSRSTGNHSIGCGFCDKNTILMQGR